MTSGLFNAMNTNALHDQKRPAQGAKDAAAHARAAVTDRGRQ